MSELFRAPAKLTSVDRLTQLHDWQCMAQYPEERFGWLASGNIRHSLIMLHAAGREPPEPARGQRASN